MREAEKKKIGVFQAVKMGWMAAWKNPAAVSLGCLAEMAGELFSIGLKVAVGVSVFSWIVRFALNALAAFLGGDVEAGVPPPPHPVRLAAPLAAAALTALLIVLFLKALWLAAMTRRSAASMEAPHEASSEAQDEAETKKPQPGIFETALSAFPRVARVFAAFLPMAVTALAICGSVLTLSGLLLWNLWGKGASPASAETKFWTAAAIALGGTVAFFAIRGTSVLFRLSAVRAAALGESALTAIANSARQIVGRLGFFVPLFIVFGVLKAMALAGSRASEGLWRALWGASGSKMALLAALYVGVALLDAALWALVASAECGSLTAEALSESGRLAVPESPARQPSRVEAPESVHTAPRPADVPVSTTIAAPEAASETVVETTLVQKPAASAAQAESEPTALAAPSAPASDSDAGASAEVIVETTLSAASAASAAEQAPAESASDAVSAPLSAPAQQSQDAAAEPFSPETASLDTHC